MVRLVITLAVLLSLVVVPAQAEPVQTPEERAAALVAQLTLDEKISLVHTTGRGAGGIARFVPGIPRLGIPDFLITNGPAGVGTGAVPQQPNATALPAPVALAASFDTDLAHHYGVLQGVETNNVGHSLIEAPDVNMVRVYHGGRAFENYGEDPYLAAQLAAANINGIQSQGVLAEVKHYTANDQELNRRTIREVIDDRVLHELHLPAFEAAVKQGNVAAVMCAFPAVNDAFMCENKHLLTDVLRNQWGFKGFVQSDANATHSTEGAVAAGQDLELRDNGPYDEALKQAVLDGRVSMQALDTMIIRILATQIRAGLFEHPRTVTPIDAAAGGAVARTVAEQSAVLLKNSARQLPLDAAALRSIAVIGPYARIVHPGGGGSSHVNPLYTVTPVDGIQRRVGPSVTVGSADGTDTAAAAQLAAASDVAVVIVGDLEREGADRPNLSLPGNQDDLVRAVVAANPSTIVVLNSGAPVLLPWVDTVPAILQAWYPGEEDGNALAGLLFGDVNPSGKLPVTFPRTESQTPVSIPERYPGVDGTVTYSEGLELGYRWYDAQRQDPLFHFGHGLSYTSFAFRNLRVSPVLGPFGNATAEVDVINTGARAGAEVAQLYVTFPAAAGEPPRQLKGFQKVMLRPGERKHLRFTLDQRAFSIWDSAAQQWATVTGRYRVSIGHSSRDLPLSAPVIVPFTLGAQSVRATAPRLVTPGETETVTTTFTNTGDFPVWRMRTELSAPAGWSVTAITPAAVELVRPRSSVHTTWRVTVPAAAPPGESTLTAAVSYHSVSGAGNKTTSAPVTVPQPSFSDSYGNSGISADTNTDVANFDGNGSSLSAQALAAAGATPGATITRGGVTLVWPDVAAGQPDNVLANGQAFRLTGKGTLAFLAASTFGPAAGSGTLVYTDGSTAPFTIGVPDWFGVPPPGSDPAIAMTYRNRPGNVQQPHGITVFAISVPLAAGKTLAAVLLPKISATATSGSPAVHIFAIAAGTS